MGPTQAWTFSPPVVLPSHNILKLMKREGVDKKLRRCNLTALLVVPCGGDETMNGVKRFDSRDVVMNVLVRKTRPGDERSCDRVQSELNGCPQGRRRMYIHTYVPVRGGKRGRGRLGDV